MVDLLIMPDFEQHFRSHVLWTSTERISELIHADIGLAQSEISESGMTVDVDEYVFGFYVSVNDVQLV